MYNTAENISMPNGRIILHNPTCYFETQIAEWRNRTRVSLTDAWNFNSVEVYV